MESPLSVPEPLGSWKEIAGYLGKGVRTVQRWEQDLGLPVRRPKSRSKGVVFALAEDIDEWLRQQETENRNTLRHELKQLRRVLEEALAENHMLRRELELTARKYQKEELWKTESVQELIKLSSELVRKAAAAQRAYAETIQTSKELGMIRRNKQP